MKLTPARSVSALMLLCLLSAAADAPTSAPATQPALVIERLDPSLRGFFSKRLDDGNLPPILAHAVVADDALLEAHRRLEMMLKQLPAVRQRLRRVGAELHIIGRDQVTSDLPEWQHMKGKPFDGNLTIDQRTRGMGGRITSCGEENLLKLPNDRYRGRDICIHEFAHCILGTGATRAARQRVDEQFRASTAKGLWKNAYAGSNRDEFFAELTMWYFGTHGDMGMTGRKPASGPDGLKAYDPDAFTLLDDFYNGRLE